MKRHILLNQLPIRRRDKLLKLRTYSFKWLLWLIIPLLAILIIINSWSTFLFRARMACFYTTGLQWTQQWMFIIRIRLFNIIIFTKIWTQTFHTLSEKIPLNISHTGDALRWSNLLNIHNVLSCRAAEYECMLEWVYVWNLWCMVNGEPTIHLHRHPQNATNSTHRSSHSVFQSLESVHHLNLSCLHFVLDDGRFQKLKSAEWMPNQTLFFLCLVLGMK